ncbi:non-canonical poly(A) RNA polymerase PAPD5/7 [Nematocida homosporus]|uniref:non-canonical poly(A) RNA polymerase PAPD5/7 n=1 Tax=Nematocida homosporus TaxID=1912981 RepID=UPI00221FBCAA|nr:non-canonical poly(A) RNA polymerase PAPD5/7 [Nematocida homosporus]KAI5186438.1 non-canonical poly(A) RNA polymerase PAPD5/7 [Nematocida homosporus]
MKREIKGRSESNRVVSIPLMKHLKSELSPHAGQKNNRLELEVRDLVDRLSCTKEELESRNYICKRVIEVGDKAGVVIYTMENLQIGVEPKTIELFCNSVDKLWQVMEELKKVAEPSTVIQGSNAIYPFITFKSPGLVYTVTLYGIDRVEEGISYIRRLLKEFPVAQQMALVIGHILKQRKLWNMSGILKEYLLILLIEGFLRSHPLVQGKSIELNDSLGALLMDFFQLYGKDMNYMNVSLHPKTGQFSRRSNKSAAGHISLIDPLTQEDIGCSYYSFKYVEELFLNLHAGMNVLLHSLSTSRLTDFWVKLS